MTETHLDGEVQAVRLGAPFRAEILVRFAHCDPAGFVFYPRYLEMFNNLVEDWFRDGLGLPFSELLKSGLGIPTAHLGVDFFAPSFLGELLAATLSVTKIGASSISLDVLLSGPGGEARVHGEVVLVLTDAARGRSQKIADDLRSRITTFLCNPLVAPIPNSKRTKSL